MTTFVDPDVLACAACEQLIGSAPTTTTPAGAVVHETCPPALIADPGIYQMTEQQYHADPVAGGSLSSSGARRILPPECPAKFRYQQQHGQPPKREFDLGHAAHQLVLGAGPEIEIIEADTYRTKAAQQQRDEARERGAVPVLALEWDQVQAMAEALRRHPVANALFDPSRGAPEQSLIWRDPQTGVMRRARFDWLPPQGSGRLIIPDYKTCASAELEALRKAMYQFGYHQQGDWYRAGARALGIAGDDAAFVFVCQEKTPPYLVTIFEPDATAMRIGAIRNRRALDIYAHCRDSGHWPAYEEGIALLSLPPWAEIEEGEHLP